MNLATRWATLGPALGWAVALITGAWLPLAVTVIGLAFTWLFTSCPSLRRMREDRVRTWAVRETEAWRRLRPCYDYGGCQWRGEGCAGKPLVLGPGVGCVHTLGKRYLDQCEVCVRAHQFCRCDQGIREIPCVISS